MARKVLFVDDDEILHLVMTKILAVHNKRFQLVGARDGFEALKKMELHGFSLIVIDLMMPRMDGLSSLSHIRETYPDVPVLLISAKPKEEFEYLTGMEGIVGYLEKPFGGRDLVKIIDGVLDDEAVDGTMRGVSPTMFLQLMEMEEKTCTIRILESQSGEGGVLYLRSGKIHDARIGIIQGEEAAHRICSWEEVDIYYRNSCPEMENRINKDMQTLRTEAQEVRDGVVVEAGGQSLEGAGKGVDHADNLKRSSSEAGGQIEHNPFRLKKILQGELGSVDWLCAVYPDPGMERIMQRLSVLGEQAQFGRLQVGYVDDGESADRILVPGGADKECSTVMQVEKNAPLNTILDLLRYTNTSTV